MNKLFYGDNLDVLRRFVRDETIDLCYIDPPFNSKRNYNQIYNNIGLQTAQSIALTNGLEKVLGKGALFAYLVSVFK
jgi:DNA modification methylase